MKYIEKRIKYESDGDHIKQITEYCEKYDLMIVSHFMTTFGSIYSFILTSNTSEKRMDEKQ